ncbi:MAG: porin [Methylibium sp.]|nr:porin [Methylibium sp.]
MKKSLVALVALSAMAASVHAQSSVTLYGVVDVGVRLIDNAGSDNDDLLTSVNGASADTTAGGISPSRWGIRVTEDLGGNYRALANIESRFLGDTGSLQTGEQFQQSWVGLVTPFGQVTLGRQYNVLFDVSALAFSPFKTMGPFLESYKPEIGMALGARNNNMLKYAIALGGFAAELQVSAGEGGQESGAATFTNGKSIGGMARYKFGDITLGGGYLEREFSGDHKAKASLIGIGYDNRKLYLNAFYIQNDIDEELAIPATIPALGLVGRAAGPAILYTATGFDNGILTGASPAGASLSSLPFGFGSDDRKMFSVGGTYLVTNSLNIGAQYWRMEQEGITPFIPAEGEVDYFAAVAQYGFSKRSSVYAIVDHTKTSGDLTLVKRPNQPGPGPDSRTGITVGILHRF